MSAPNTPPPAMSEFMTPMYQDIMIKEYNNPEPGSEAQEPEGSKSNMLLVFAKMAKVQVELLEEEISKVKIVRNMSMVCRLAAAGERIMELRRAADGLLEILDKEEAGESEDAGSGETQAQSGDLSEGQGKDEEADAYDRAG